MTRPNTLTETLSAQMHRGTVVVRAGRTQVRLSDEEGRFANLEAQVLYTSEERLRLVAGDTVLCWVDPERPGDCVIVGRVGPSDGSEVSSTLPPSVVSEQLPDILVLEARKNLTLKCGEGSITIREDGKILIKGTDLVSHAQRMNRIKGGSVSIN